MACPVSIVMQGYEEKGTTQHDGGGPELAIMEDDDLFEIDLKAVDDIPPPSYLENYFTSTDCALFANCLLPIADVCNAIPILHGGRPASMAASNVASTLLMLNRLMTPELPGFPSLSRTSRSDGVNDKIAAAAGAFAFVTEQVPSYLFDE